MRTGDGNKVAGRFLTIEGTVHMNEILKAIKADLKNAMTLEVQFRKENVKDGDHYDLVIAQKTVSRAIISMIPETGKKPGDTTEEDIFKLLKKYIGNEKERTLYELSFLKRDDVEGKSAPEVKKIVKDKIQELGTDLTSYHIKLAQNYLPESASAEEISEFIETLDLSQFKNKMQAMGLIMKQFPGCDGNTAKKVLLAF